MDKILENLCKELNENCKYKDEYNDKDAWYPNYEWGIEDLSINIKECRKYCYTSHAYVYNEYSRLCNNCEEILHKHLDKYKDIFNLSHEDLCLEMYLIKEELKQIKQHLHNLNNLKN